MKLLADIPFKTTWEEAEEFAKNYHFKDRDYPSDYEEMEKSRECMRYDGYCTRECLYYNECN